ncbi:MAG: hypothetical protein ACO1QR_10075 [Chthoniobacteraceae bacterium]
MDSPLFLRSVVPLVLGLAVGGLGASLFLDSLPAPEGSPEERVRTLELELERTQKRLAAAEAAQGQGAGGRSGSARALSDSVRVIGEDIRAGRTVNPEELFRTSKPILRDLAPIFDRMRLKEQKAVIDGMTGEFTRKYQLTPGQEQALKEWFGKRAEEEAERWTDMLGADNTRLEDIIRASRDIRPDEGVEEFMKGILPPDQYATFQADRLEERAERVQREADTKVQRLDRIVGLDETQRDQVFSIVARNSRDYDPKMLEIPDAGGAGNGDVLSVLRPEQRTAYDAERKRRYEEASKAAAEIGMSLPANWELMNDDF